MNDPAFYKQAGQTSPSQKNIMKAIKVGLDGLSPLDKVAKSMFIETKMAGNLAFPTPVPALTVLTAAREALEESIANTLNGGKAATFARNEAEEALDEVITQLAGYVVSTVGSNEALIRSSGFDVRQRGLPIGSLPAPANLRADLTEFQGQIKLAWDRERGAVLNEVYQSDGDPNDETTWKMVAMTTRSRFIVEHLTSGKTYWFRVRAQGTAGESPISGPARSMAR
jgi:hypothetical protein